MKLLISNKYEDCLAVAKQSMLRYFAQNGLNWHFDERLALYRTCELYEVIDEITIGYIALRENDNKLFLADFQILPKFQNMGYGTAVLSALNGIAKSKGHDYLYLKVFKSNPALHFYLRNGYNQVAEEQFVYILSSKT